jgi:hypothetical protein
MNQPAPTYYERPPLQHAPLLRPGFTSPIHAGSRSSLKYGPSPFDRATFDVCHDHDTCCMTLESTWSQMALYYSRRIQSQLSFCLFFFFSFFLAGIVCVLTVAKFSINSLRFRYCFPFIFFSFPFFCRIPNSHTSPSFSFFLSHSSHLLCTSFKLPSSPSNINWRAGVAYIPVLLLPCLSLLEAFGCHASFALWDFNIDF